MNLKKKYISSAMVLLLSTIIVKVIGAVYKIPLTSFIGAIGRGYFAYAYNLVMPIHAITMGALPVALSKLTSTYNSNHNTDRVIALQRGSRRLFFYVGAAGMVVVMLLALPYSKYIVSAPKGIYTALVLAPSVLFSCMSASYRGHYEGMLNMVPTAVSQSVEALFKMVFGLLFARFTMMYLYDCYDKTGLVFGAIAKNSEEALSLIYPFTSAGAMAGVTFGSLASFCYLWLYSVIKPTEKIKSCNTKDANRELLSFAFPIMVSTGIQSAFQFLDTATIKIALDNVNILALKNQLQNALDINPVKSSDLSTYAYGILSSSMDFKNLIPGVTMALGVCAVPVVSRAYEQGNRERLSALVSTIIKYVLLLSSLGALLLYSLSGEILSLFYGKGSLDIAVGSKAFVEYFAISVPIYCLAGIAVFIVQAIGLPKKSVPSYIVCGVIRVVLNIVLVSNGKLVLYGAVISGGISFLILAIWNIIIIVKYTNIGLSISNLFMLPIIVFLLSFFLSRIANDFLPQNINILINLSIKSIFVVLIYSILCFLCGLLNFKEFFCYFHHKKIL